MSQYDNLNFNLMNKFSHDSIIKHMCQNEGAKNLILSADLVRVLDVIIKFSELKEHGLNKVYKIDAKLDKSPNDRNIQWIYIVRPEIDNIKYICKQIKSDIKQNCLSMFKYKVLFSPRKLYICDLLFEQEGLYEYVELSELENDLIQLDHNLVSMEYPRFFVNYYLSGDQSWLINIAKSLINIQNWFGSIPNVHLHGTCAKNVFELMNRLNQAEKSMKAEENGSSNRSSSSSSTDYKFGHLILIDRNIDYITPFCSPLTYEGLLDDTFKINAGFIDVPIEASTDAPSSAVVKTKRYKLSSEDKIFDEIRGMHVSEVFPYLKGIVSNLKSTNERKHELSSIGELKEFIQKDLKDYTKYKELVILHLNISELVIKKSAHVDLNYYLGIEHSIIANKDYRKSLEYIEELICRNFDMIQVLRLMILLSKTNDGLSTGDYNSLRTQFLHTYGFDKVTLLQKLARMGLFETSGSSNVIKGSGGEDASSAAGSATFKESGKDIAPKLVQQLVTRTLKYATHGSYGNMLKKFDIIPNDLTQPKSKHNDMSYAFNGTYRPILCKYIMQILSSVINPSQSNANLLDEYAKYFPGEYEHIYRGLHTVKNRNPALSNDKNVLIYFLGGCTFAELAVLSMLAEQKGYRFYYATTSFFNLSTMINYLVD